MNFNDLLILSLSSLSLIIPCVFIALSRTMKKRKNENRKTEKRDTLKCKEEFKITASIKILLKSLHHLMFTLASFLAAVIYFEGALSITELNILPIFLLVLYQLSHIASKFSRKNEFNTEDNIDRKFTNTFKFFFQIGYLAIGSSFLIWTTITIYFEMNPLNPSAVLMSLSALTFLMALWHLSSFIIVIIRGKDTETTGILTEEAGNEIAIDQIQEVFEDTIENTPLKED